MKLQINSILIPTDFSDLSASALQVGIAIAKRQDARITLLHVVDTFFYIQPTEVFLPEARLTPDVKLQVREKLTALSKRIQKETGVKVTGIVSEGSPSDRICRLAHKKQISLIVMGTHGTSGIRKFFIGSESFRVIKNATCPVLTIPGAYQKTDFERILFPVRLKRGALDKYFFARPIIEKNNSEIMLLGLADQKKQEDLQEVTELMDKLKVQLYTDRVIFHSASTVSKDLPATILDMSAEFRADLIVLSSNLDTNFKAFFLGPFTQQVVNHSTLPVLTIKPSAGTAADTSSHELAQKWGKSIHFPG